MKKHIFNLGLCLLITTHLSAQKYPYKNLVLEGGGIRGFAYVGAFEVLDSMGIIKGIEKIGGSSAGAIQATLLAIGYNPSEMVKLAEEVPLKAFNDGFLPGGLWRIKRNFGFYKGKKIYKWIEDLINAKTGSPDITFLQLHQQAESHNYKDLYITGTDLTYRCQRVFSYKTYPNMRIKDALRISFSIPLYFEPLRIDDNGMIVTDKNDATAHLMVDGGLISNYPIQMFDTAYSVDGKNLVQLNKQTLGLLLDRPEQQKYQTSNSGNYPMPTNTLDEYLTAVYQTIIDKPNPDKADLRRTITISHMNMSGRVRKLSPKTIRQLVDNGRMGVRLFFEAMTDTGEAVHGK